MRKRTSRALGFAAGIVAVVALVGGIVIGLVVARLTQPVRGIETPPG